jgi:hypothetical protein
LLNGSIKDNAYKGLNCFSTDKGVGGGGVFIVDGTFEIKGGEISGNKGKGSGAGVAIGCEFGTAVFTMTGGSIKENAGEDYIDVGGGVYVYGGYLDGYDPDDRKVTFTMTGGEISGNIVGNGYDNSYGGGVYIEGSKAVFNMSGGEIKGNTSGNGGGICIYRGPKFTMSGRASISGNKASFGGGIYLEGSDSNQSIFEMEGGEISGNTAYRGGGVETKGDFTMNGGKISGNSTTSEYDFYGGGGVYVGGNFIMNGGEISGNTAKTNGGGVYVDNNTFKMSGGTIYGNNEASADLKKTAASGSALWVNDNDDTNAYWGGYNDSSDNTPFAKIIENTIIVVNGVKQSP